MRRKSPLNEPLKCKPTTGKEVLIFDLLKIQKNDKSRVQG